MKVSPRIEWVHKFISLILEFENYLTKCNVGVTIYVICVTLCITKVTAIIGTIHN